jgi:hypothetical protein
MTCESLVTNGGDMTVTVVLVVNLDEVGANVT